MNWQTSGDENRVCVSRVHDMIWYTYTEAHTRRIEIRSELIIPNDSFGLGVFFVFFFFGFVPCLHSKNKLWLQNFVLHFTLEFDAYQKCKRKKQREKRATWNVCTRRNAITIEMYAQHCYNTHAVGHWLIEVIVRLLSRCCFCFLVASPIVPIRKIKIERM